MSRGRFPATAGERGVREPWSGPFDMVRLELVFLLATSVVSRSAWGSIGEPRYNASSSLNAG
jgi:hypothetical protein